MSGWRQHIRLYRAAFLVVVPIFVALVVFVSIEVTLRMFAPQDTVALEDIPAGVPDAEIGYVLRPNYRFGVRCPEYELYYSTNAQGFRSWSDFQDSVGTGTTRILVFGDSFTFGQGVAVDSVWLAIAGTVLRGAGLDVEIMNAGVQGYDTRSELLSMRRWLPRFRPDIVLFGFMPNDLFTNIPADVDTTGQSDVRDVAGHGNRNEYLSFHIVTLAKRILMMSDRLYQTLYSLTARREYYTRPPTKHVQQQDKITRALLDSASVEAQNAGANFAVVSIPQLYQVLSVSVGKYDEGVDPVWIDSDYAAHAQERGYQWIPTLDTLVTNYRTRQNDLYFRLDGHLNERGHRVVGEYVARQIRALMPVKAITLVN
jgi:lysophospholipase L1-like esterase